MESQAFEAPPVEPPPFEGDATPPARLEPNVFACARCQRPITFADEVVEERYVAK